MRIGTQQQSFKFGLDEFSFELTINRSATFPTPFWSKIMSEVKGIMYMYVADSWNSKGHDRESNHQTRICAINASCPTKLDFSERCL